MKKIFFCALLILLEFEMGAIATEQCFSGLIGVESYDPSQGKFAVGMFCDKAKQLGLNYLVFTEDVSLLNKTKWNQFVADCKTNTADGFIAIPGIKYRDAGWKANFRCFSMDSWINQSLVTSNGLISEQSGVLFGLNWPAMVLASPARNGFPPWAVKFYTGFAVYTYEDGILCENSLDAYLARQGNCYNLFPSAIHSIKTPLALERATGFKTIVRADKVSEIPNKFKGGRRSIFVSDGPLVTNWKIENDTEAFPLRPWTINFSITSAAEIKEVILYDKNEVYRRFLPGGTNFSASVSGWQDKQHYFVLRAVDVNGKEAITSVQNTTSPRHVLFMCADQQNTLDGATLTVKETDEVVQIGVMGAYDTGWNGGRTGILVPGNEIMPEGLDYIAKGFAFSCAGMSAVDGRDNPVARRDIAFGSGDCTILDNYYEYNLGPNNTFVSVKFADMKVRFISFTPRLYSYNPLLIESATRFKKKVSLADVEGPEVVPITVDGTESSFENYTYWGADGLKHQGKRAKGLSLSAKILQGGYVSLWPNFYGAFALYTFDSNQTAYLRGTSVKVGLDEPGKEVAEGAVINNKYLLVRDKFGSASDEGFDNLRTTYGFASKVPYRVVTSHGKVLDRVFALTVEAKDHYFGGVISKAELPNDLPVIVKGLNGNWDAGIFDPKSGEFRRVGIFEETAYVTLDLSYERDIYIGNLLVCDNPQIKLAVTRISKDGIEFEAHNPTDQLASVTIRSSKRLGLFPVVMKQCVLKPGESQVFVTSPSKSHE